MRMCNNIFGDDIVKMKFHLLYLRNLFIHKWYVIIESRKLGILWRGLTHDLSKLTLREWLPRARAMEKGTLKNGYGLIDHNHIDDELSLSWLHHYHRNPHHWQWWVTNLDCGSIKVLPMDDEYRREMLADWLAVSRMPDRMNMIPWYMLNQDKMLLHPKTREWLEEQLGIN